VEPDISILRKTGHCYFAYRLCSAGHHMDWNLLDASSHAEPLGRQRFGNPLRPSTEETAQIMGISASAVKARVFHGRRKLRAKLKNYVG
jgi:hypothetical protein